MNILHLIAIMAAMGLLGGVVNCLLAGEFQLPRYDKKMRKLRIGSVGTILVGGVAAAVIWGIYGSLASYDLFGTAEPEAHLTVGQLFISLVVGIGGGRILTLETQKLILRNERDAEKTTSVRLAASVKALENRTHERTQRTQSTD